MSNACWLSFIRRAACISWNDLVAHTAALLAIGASIQAFGARRHERFNPPDRCKIVKLQVTRHDNVRKFG